MQRLLLYVKFAEMSKGLHKRSLKRLFLPFNIIKQAKNNWHTIRSQQLVEFVITGGVIVIGEFTQTRNLN